MPSYAFASTSRSDLKQYISGLQESSSVTKNLRYKEYLNSALPEKSDSAQMGQQQHSENNNSKASDSYLSTSQSQRILHSKPSKEFANGGSRNQSRLLSRLASELQAQSQEPKAISSLSRITQNCPINSTLQISQRKSIEDNSHLNDAKVIEDFYTTGRHKSKKDEVRAHSENRQHQLLDMRIDPDEGALQKGIPVINNKLKESKRTAKCLSARATSMSSNGSSKRIQDINKQASMISLSKILPNHEDTKFSLKRNGVIRAYAANTNQGIYRNYNEDRVSIILNIVKPGNKDPAISWPKCSFFGIYDGHGGSLCADFLRDNLHHFIIRNKAFPANPKIAIRNGFLEAEQFFLTYAKEQNIDPDQQMPTLETINKSGSCAIIALIVEETVYISNVGDSRAILSGSGGSKIYSLSKDHKPSEASEQQRITDNGGKLYQTKLQSKIPLLNNCSILGSQINKQNSMLGPIRVLPGRLSVSRTFGDIEAKDTLYGGKPGVIVAEPEIKTFRVQHDHDFILMGCDGIFDKLTNREIIDLVWANAKKKVKDLNVANSSKDFDVNIHHLCANSVELILQESINKKTLDNITVVLISFQSFKKELISYLEEEQKTQVVSMENQDSIEQKTSSQGGGGHRKALTEINTARETRTVSLESHQSSADPSQSPTKDNDYLLQSQAAGESLRNSSYFPISTIQNDSVDKKPQLKGMEEMSQRTRSRLDKIIQRYDQRVHLQSNISELNKKSLLFKKSIDQQNQQSLNSQQQKQQNLYAILKSKNIIDKSKPSLIVKKSSLLGSLSNAGSSTSLSNRNEGEQNNTQRSVSGLLKSMSKINTGSPSIKTMSEKQEQFNREGLKSSSSQRYLIRNLAGSKTSRETGKKIVLSVPLSQQRNQGPSQERSSSSYGVHYGGTQQAVKPRDFEDPEISSHSKSSHNSRSISGLFKQ